MTAVGMFAGRGDVVLAMLMAAVFGVWVGAYGHILYLRFKAWNERRRAAKTR